MLFKLVPMKSTIIFFLFLFPLVSLSSSVYQDVVLGEIQKTLIKDYGASEGYWTNENKVNKRKQVKQVKQVKLIKKVEKNLIDEDDGWVKYKKRKKRGLIDDGE